MWLLLLLATTCFGSLLNQSPGNVTCKYTSAISNQARNTLISRGWTVADQGAAAYNPAISGVTLNVPVEVDISGSTAETTGVPIPIYQAVYVNSSGNFYYSDQTPRDAAPLFNASLVLVTFSGYNISNQDLIYHDYYNAPNTTNAIVLATTEYPIGVHEIASEHVQYQSFCFTQIGYGSTPVCWTGSDYCYYPLLANGILNSTILSNLTEVAAYVETTYGAGYQVDTSSGCWYHFTTNFKKRAAPLASVRAAFQPQLFQFTWTTTVINQVCQMPISATGGGSLSFDVDWGDGMIQTNRTTSITHTYAAIGTYQVTVAGQVPTWSFSTLGNANALATRMRDVLQWGNVVTKRLDFQGATNLGNLTATDFPNPSINNMANLFRSCTSVRTDMGNWQVGNVTTFNSAFLSASVINPTTTSWNTGAVTDMAAMFQSAFVATPDTSGWNTGSVTSMASMFSSANLANPNTSNWNTGKVTTMASMFFMTSSANPDVTNWDTGNVTTMASMFQSAMVVTLTTSGNWNTGKVTTMASMFNVATSATPNVNNWNVSAVTDLSYFFYGSNKLYITSWNTQNVVSFGCFLCYFNTVNSTVSNIYVGPTALTAAGPFSIIGGGATLSGFTMSNWTFATRSAPSTILSTPQNGLPLFYIITISNSDLSGWTIGGNVSVAGLFRQSVLTNVNLNNWSFLYPGPANGCANMFYRANIASPTTLFGWSTSGITDANSMFTQAIYGSATTINVQWSTWDTSNIVSFASFLNTLNFASFNPSGMENWNTSSATNMASMFLNAPAVGSVLNITNWDVSKVTTMNSMFRNGFGNDPIVTNWNTKSVTDMGSMFLTATGANPDVSGWDVSKVTNMASMFSGASAFRPFITTWNTVNVTDMSSMFASTNLVGSTISNILIGSTTTITSMFASVSSMVNITLDNWTIGSSRTLTSFFNGRNMAGANVNNWSIGSGCTCASMFQSAVLTNALLTDWTFLGSTTSAVSMFQSAVAGGAVIGTDWNTAGINNMGAMFYLSVTSRPNTVSWNTGSVTSMASMFRGASAVSPSVANPDMSGWDTSKVTNMQYMFEFTSLATANTTGGWNTSAVTDMQYMFDFAIVARPVTNGWDTSKVTTMFATFANAPLANPDVSGWDTSKVTTMRSMFQSATIAQPDTSEWDTSSVTSMLNMFYATNLANPNVSNWDVSKVTEMSGMFASTSSANPDTSNWNTGSVTNMASMFASAVVANPDTSNWNTANVTTMNAMFASALVANPSVNGWNTNKVIDMRLTFYNTQGITHYITTWNTTGVSYMSQMFQFSRMINARIENFYVGTSTWMGAMFNYGSSSNYTNANLNYWTFLSGNYQGYTDFDVRYFSGDMTNASFSNWYIGPAVYSLRRWFSGCTMTNFVMDNWTLAPGRTLYQFFDGGTRTNMSMNGWNIGSSTSVVLFYFGGSGRPKYMNNWVVGDGVAISGNIGVGSQNVVGGSFANWTVGASDIGSFFSSATLTGVDVSGWTINGPSSLAGMFQSASMSGANLDGWDTRGVTSMASMFQGVANPVSEDIFTSWNRSSVTSMASMFQSANLAGYNLANLVIQSPTTTVASMFQSATLTNANLDNMTFPTSIAANGMFQSASMVNTSLYGWDTSGITNMASMFQLVTATVPASTFTSWNTAAVTSMASMFQSTTTMDPDVSNWNTSAVTSMASMFQSTNLANPDVSDWDVSKVTTMDSMFSSSAKAQPDISLWSTPALTTANSMFASALVDMNASYTLTLNSNVFKNLPLHTNMFNTFWARNIVSNLNLTRASGTFTMLNMFQSSGVINAPISSWDMSACTSVNTMFASTTTSDPDISGWNLTGITNTGAFLTSTTISQAKYDIFLMKWAAQSTLATQAPGALAGRRYTAAIVSAARAALVTRGWTLASDSAAVYTPLVIGHTPGANSLVNISGSTIQSGSIPIYQLVFVNRTGSITYADETPAATAPLFSGAYVTATFTGFTTTTGDVIYHEYYNAANTVGAYTTPVIAFPIGTYRIAQQTFTVP